LPKGTFTRRYGTDFDIPFVGVYGFLTNAARPSRSRRRSAGIYAALPLSEALIGELKKGKELRVAMQLQKEQPLKIKVPFTGFPAAFDKVRSVKWAF
jgi:hypothetical protein